MSSFESPDDESIFVVEIPHQLDVKAYKTTKNNLYWKAQEMDGWEFLHEDEEVFLGIVGGDRELLDDDLVEILEKHGEAIEINRGHGDGPYYFNPDEGAPDPFDWAVEAVGHDLNRIRIFDSAEGAYETVLNEGQREDDLDGIGIHKWREQLSVLSNFI